jgi:hypothetical protein
MPRSAPQFRGSTSSRQLLRPRAIPIRNQAGAVVGTVRLLNGQLTFVKLVNPPEHQLRHPPAWANDRVVLDRVRDAGAGLVCHEDRGTRRRWWATLAVFSEHGFPVERGYGDQVGLPLKFWRVEDPGAPKQLDLFAG